MEVRFIFSSSYDVYSDASTSNVLTHSKLVRQVLEILKSLKNRPASPRPLKIKWFSIKMILR